MKEFEYIVTGWITVAAHCRDDADQAVKDALDGCLSSHDAVCVG